MFIKKSRKKSVSQLLNILQKVFNTYIRQRDSINETYFVCISCNTPKLLDQMNAGHFYSAGGHSALRFDEDNTHGQCIACNLHKHGNLVPYREHLIKKIGPERFEKLTLRRHNKSNLGVFEIELLIKIYRDKIKKCASLKNYS